MGTFDLKCMQVKRSHVTLNNKNSSQQRNYVTVGSAVSELLTVYDRISYPFTAHLFYCPTEQAVTPCNNNIITQQELVLTCIS